MKKLKHRKKTRNEVYGENERAMRELSKMRHRDLQRACIVRGLPSQELVDFDHWRLVQWFTKNFENNQDEKLLLDHDLWVEEQLKEHGYTNGDALLSPALRFSYIGNIEEMEKPKSPKPQIAIKINKVKSTIDEITGIRSGTKKALTYELALMGKGIDEIIKKVKEKFPEAQDKSIKIWARKSLKGNV